MSDMIKRLNQKISIDLLLFVTLVLFLLLQLKSLLNINVIEHTIETGPFIIFITVLIIFLPILLLVTYYLPLVAIIKYNVKLPPLKVNGQYIDYVQEVVVIKLYFNKQKNFCVFRC